VAELLAGSGPEVDPVLRSLHAADVELREFARGIRPPVLVAQGLAGALDELAQRCPLPVDLDVPQVRLDPARESAAYFICSEAIANAVKHARASRLAVRVTAAGGVVVEVEDDGVGGADATRGSGLRGLAERAEAFGGRLRVDSDPGQGTRLTAWLAPGANG
jgi:signal transduction histidine kinase